MCLHDSAYKTINACPSWSVFRTDVNPHRVKRIILQNVKFDTFRVSLLKEKIGAKRPLKFSYRGSRG